MRADLVARTCVPAASRIVSTRHEGLTALLCAFAAFAALAFGQEGFESAYRAGLIALGQNRLQAAQTNLEAARNLEPGDPHVWLALAQTYWKLRKLVPADSAAASARKLAGGDPLVFHGLAIYFSGRGQPAKAAEMEATYVRKVPGDRSAVPRAMSLFLDAGQPKQAIEVGLAAPGWEGRAEVRNLLGKAYAAGSQFDKALEELQEAIRLSPAEGAYHFDLARFFLEHQNFDAAIQLLEASRQRFPLSAQIELALGVAHYGQGHFPEAVDAFLKTISLDPKVEQPYIFLGRIIEQANQRLPEVTQRFIDFERSNPGNYLGYFLHAKALAVHLDDPKLAGDLLRKSISLKEEFWESHFQLGMILEKQKLFSEAAREYERTVRLNPKSPLPHYRLCLVLFRLGKTEQSKAERALYEKLRREERAVVDQRLAGITRLDLLVK